MKYSEIDKYALSFPGTRKDYKIEWGWERYMLEDKMFLALCYENDKLKYITLKLDPQKGEFLRRQYADVIPGYYMNKVHWNSVKPDGCVPDELLKDMIEESYNLILSGFSKKKQTEIISQN